MMMMIMILVLSKIKTDDDVDDDNNNWNYMNIRIYGILWISVIIMCYNGILDLIPPTVKLEELSYRCTLESSQR